MTDVALREPGSLALLVDLERAGALTPTALTLDPDTSYERYEALLGMLGQVHRSASWIIGDAVEFGERIFGEKFAQAIEATGLAPTTLMNYASVCRRVPPERRRASLPFSSHALVASLPPREQTKWLKRAEAEDWTRRELDSALKGDLPPEVEPPSLTDLARAVWLSARQTAEGYVVPVEPMRALGEAL